MRIFGVHAGRRVHSLPTKYRIQDSLLTLSDITFSTQAPGCELVLISFHTVKLISLADLWLLGQWV